MKTTIISAALPERNFNLTTIIDIIKKTLEELDLEDIEIFDIGKTDFYNRDNYKNQMNKIYNSIKQSDGVILAATASMFSVNSLMHNFLEYLFINEQGDCLENKNSFLISVSATGDELYGIEYLSKAISRFKGYESLRMAIGNEYIGRLGEDNSLKDIIEKQTEDYYRIIRQKRKFFVPKTTFGIRDNNSEIDDDTNYSEYYPLDKELKIALSKMPQPKDFENLNIKNGVSNSTEKIVKKRLKTEDIYEKYNLDKLDDQQEEDVKELTQFFANKFELDKEENALISKGETPVEIDYSVSVPRERTCKQMTESLVHYFKPSFVKEPIDAYIQLDITGEETFGGHFHITNNSCNYFDEEHDDPDITITCDSKYWLDVITGKNTAQKSFMIGRLKVRGNFLLLSQFDSMFSFEDLV